MNKCRAAEISELGSIYNPNWSQHTLNEDGQERIIREECWLGQATVVKTSTSKTYSTCHHFAWEFFM